MASLAYEPVRFGVGLVELLVEIVEGDGILAGHLLRALTDARLLVKHGALQTQELDVLGFACDSQRGGMSSLQCQLRSYIEQCRGE